MVSREQIRRAIRPLPPRLRSELLDRIIERLQEAREIGRTKKEIDEMAIDITLQELHSALVEPIDMIERILKSRILEGSDGFKVDYGRALFSVKFIEKSVDFRGDFLSLVEKLGHGGIVFGKQG